MARKRRPPHPPARATPSAWDSLYPTLDLHGHTAAEARSRTARWLAEQQAAGARTVRVITGKGLRSVGPPVLRGEVEGLLRRLRGGVVARFAAEPGGGVVRVELRRTPRRIGTGPPAGGAPRGALHQAEPELRRRAEEALWELGVQPTPELLEAEIRRMLAEAADRGG